MRSTFVALITLCAAFNCAAQSITEKLDRAFSSFQHDEQTKYASTSFCVLNANSGELVFSRNENQGLATASTLKTITSTTAFYLLGANYQYKTTLSYSGTLSSDGTLNGNVIIKGSGDPSLGSDRYQNTKAALLLGNWVKAIKDAGIKKINGSIIGDDNLFGTQSMPEGWIWQDMGNYYGAGGSALTWRENQFDIVLRPGKNVGDPVTIVTTSPKMPYVKLVNELKTGESGSGDGVYVYLPPYGDVAYLRGTWGIDCKKNGVAAALPDAAFDCAFRLQDTLIQQGITTSGNVTTTRRLAMNQQMAPTKTTQLYESLSPTLAQLVYWFNKKSINLYGEQLLKTMAFQQKGIGSTQIGAQVVKDFWTKQGLDPNTLNIIDGSGLSPATRVTAASMTKVLFTAQKESWFPQFYDSLPEYNGMKIKSGTINNVSAFAGYHTASDGKKYIAVIYVNNYSGSGINKKIYRVLDTLK